MKKIIGYSILAVFLLFCAYFKISTYVRTAQGHEVVFSNHDIITRSLDFNKCYKTPSGFSHTGQIYAGDNRYIYAFYSKTKDGIQYLLDTQNDSLLEESQFQPETPMPGYAVKEKTYGVYDIVDLSTNTILETVNVQEHYDFTGREINVELSPQMDYIVFKQEDYFAVAYSIHSRKLINIPIERSPDQRFYIKWSPNGKKAILGRFKIGVGHGDEKCFLWYADTNEVVEIEGRRLRELYWSAYNQIYCESSGDAGEGYSNRPIAVFNETAKQMENVYFPKSDISIHEESIRWLSQDEFIYVCRGASSSSWSALFMSYYDYYAFKVNIKNKTEQKVLIDAALWHSAWSQDNNYLYYVEDRGLFKAKVNFGNPSQ